MSHFEEQAARCAAMKVIPADRPNLRTTAAKYLVGIRENGWELEEMSNLLIVSGVNIDRLTEQFEIFKYN